MSDAELLLKSIESRLNYVQDGGATHYGWHLPSRKEQQAGLMGEIWGLQYAAELCRVAIKCNHLTEQLTGKTPADWRDYANHVHPNDAQPEV